MNVLVVGCGITGVTLARLLAEASHDVTVVECRDHIGGNCFDYFNEAGIDVHRYGTHIFHTENAEVWHFLSRFTKWFPYQHQVKALIDGQLVPLPFNFNSIEQLFPASMARRLIEALLSEFPFNKKVPILKLKASQNKDLRFLAEYVYEKVFAQYTFKQWNIKPEDIDPMVTGRVPVFVGRDNRYFQSKYQGIPLEGYTKMLERMLDLPNISLKLSTFFSKEVLKDFDQCFYTGAIDEFFEYQLGQLPYRSLKFDFLTFDRPYFQSNSVVNYPCNYDFTRIGEYKYFLDTQCDSTIVSYEYPEAFEIGKNERYYPIISDKNSELYQRYLALARGQENVFFVGRLGDYKYYDMDQAVSRVLKVLRNHNLMI